MPDISMCSSGTCPKRRECYRNPESGTVPSERRQSWLFVGALDEPCEYLIPTTNPGE